MTTPPTTAVRRLAFARAISLTGGAASFAALNFVIYERTQSATWVAAALFLTFGTVGFVGLFAGALGDRFDRKRVMVVSDLAGAVCFAAMAFVHEPAWLLVVAFLSALAESPFLAASAAAIPNLVEEDRIAWANGLIGVGRNVGILIGPMIGGALVGTIGAGAVFGLNSVSFVLSAALAWSVHGNFAGVHDEHDESEHSGVSAGVRFIARDRVLRSIALAWVAIAGGLGMSMVADVPLVSYFGAGGIGYGVLIAAWGGGSIVGSLLGRFLNRRTEPVAFAVGSGVIAVTGILAGLSPWFVGVLVALFFMGIGDGGAVVSQQGIMQRRTPDAVRSRVAAALEAVMNISLALSYVVAGPVVAWLGPRGTYVFGGAISLLAVLAAVPALEARREPDEGEEGGAHTGDAASLVLGDTSGAGYPAGSSRPSSAAASATPAAAASAAAGPAASDGSAAGTETETTVSTR
ncbi:MAG TPA: MFS transporter [Actinomycetota bacterium]|nr:MFS transporter [Actinomycetota bacterium]